MYVADEKTVKLFTQHKVFTESELISRRDVKLNTYSKTLKIEALTMLEMTKRDILPAVIKFKGKVANEINALREEYPHLSGEVLPILRNVDCILEHEEAFRNLPKIFKERRFPWKRRIIKMTF